MIFHIPQTCFFAVRAVPICLSKAKRYFFPALYTMGDVGGQRSIELIVVNGFGAIARKPSSSK
jgi:hypothetical protein